MELRTNCKNCGASLHYDETKYGKKVRCQYCRQEYHVDLLGRVEENIIKIEIMGTIKEYYISTITMEPLWFDTGRSIDGTLCIAKPITKTKLELIEF